MIRIRPGVYREVVHVDKPKIQLRGEGDDWKKVVLVYGNSAASTCGTSCSATLFVTGSDFFAGNMTIANDYSKTSDVPSQAVALSVRADRAVLRHVRLLGAQDTSVCLEHGVYEGRGRVRDRAAVLLPIAISKGMWILSSAMRRLCLRTARFTAFPMRREGI